jgi:hypothetical protein
MSTAATQIRRSTGRRGGRGGSFIEIDSWWFAIDTSDLENSYESVIVGTLAFEHADRYTSKKFPSSLLFSLFIFWDPNGRGIA